MGARRIVGNLDCEVSFALAAARGRGELGVATAGPGDSRWSLPIGVERAISAYATLLRAFAREGDRLWTPQPVDPARVPQVPGLYCPSLESGALQSLPASAEILAWGETQEVQSMGAGQKPCARHPERPDSLLADAVWAVGRAPASVAMRANHRGLCLEMAGSLGIALGGAKVLRSLPELDVHLEDGGASAAPSEGWVLKVPFSAAGRSRFLARGRRLDEPGRRRVERLLELHGELLFEPWMARMADFGCCAIVDDRLDGGRRDLGVHLQEVDRGGGFRGIRLASSGSEASWLTSAERELLDKVLTHVGVHLTRLGYRGPVGIDCWRYRDAAGAVKFHALGEINARMSFGLVARVLVDRLRMAGTIGADDEVRLRLGKAEELRQAGPSGTTMLPLLTPSAAEPSAAWLEFLAQNSSCADRDAAPRLS